MLFQKVLKGIPGLAEADADQVLDHGIMCNWWRRVDPLPRPEVPDRLTDAELLDHIAHYDEPVPGEAYTYGQNSPFISTSAGTYQTTSNSRYKYFSAEWTAIRFATRTFRDDGAVFAIWLPVMGRPSVGLEGFAEEIRDPNQYPTAYGFHSQGEVTAKIIIPPAQIERYDLYAGGAAASDYRSGARPSPVGGKGNARYFAPEKYANIRDWV